MDKILIGLIFLLILITGCEQGSNYEIVGDSVLINDSNIYLKATPHTLSSSGWVETELESKLFSGEIDFAFGFDTTELKPKRLQIYDPHEEDIEYSYTCNYDFNYTTNPNYFTCYSTSQNGTTVYHEGSFDYGNLETQTAYWNETIETDWRDWNVLNSIDYDFDGKNKWYFSTNKNIQAGQTYKIRYYLEVNPGAINSKYDLAIKPSSETIEEAIDNGHFYYLDPWADYNLDTGILAYYKLDDDTISDTNADDSTDQGRNGTLVNGPQSIAGIINEGRNILTTKAIDVSDDTQTRLESGGTINMWFDLSGLTNGGRVFEKNNGFNCYFDVSPQAIACFIGGSSAMVTTNSINESVGYSMVTFIFQDAPGIGSIFVNGTNVTSTGTGRDIPDSTGDNLILGNRFGRDRPINAKIDEIGMWNRTLIGSEITGLWNNGLGLEYGGASSDTMAVTDHTITPAQAYASTGELNCSARVSSLNSKFFNATLNWTNSTDFLQQITFNNKVNGSYISNNLTGHPFKVDEVINCSVFAVSFINSSINHNSSVTNTILQTIPFWTAVRTNKTQYHTENISLDFNCTDPDGAVSYYIDAFGTDLQSPLTINEVSGNISHNPTYNDTGQFDFNVTCVQGGVNISKVLNLTLNQSILFGQHINFNPISEGMQQTFHFDIGITNYSFAPIGMTLQYNGSNYTPTPTTGTEGNTNYYNYSTSVFISDGQGDVNGFNQTYNWTFNITDVFTNFESNNSNFSIYSVAIDDCTSYGDSILNFTLKDEENNTLLLGDIEVDIDLASWNNRSLTWNFSKKWTNVTNATICVPDQLLNATSYMIEFEVQYNAPGTHAEEFFFLDYGNLSSLSTLNSYTNKVINLMDLLLTDSTTVLFRYYDQNGLQVDDTIMIAYRKYVGEGIFRDVERAKQDDNGLSTLHLVEEDALYYYTITQNGTILFTSETSNVKCTESVCSIDLQASEDFIPFDYDYDLVDDAIYSITTDSGTRTATLTFEGDSQGNWSLELYKYQNNPDDAVVVNQSELISTAGTVVVYAPQTAGNITFVVRLRKDGVFLSDKFADFSGTNLDIFRTAGGTFLGAMVILAMGLMAVTEGPVVIVFFIIGLAITGILGLLEFSWTAFILISLLGGLLLWKLSKKQV